jgi:competence protein ComEA
MNAVKTVFAGLVLVSVVAASMNAAAAQGSGEPTVNLNTATSAELSYLPGIGPSKAEAIIRHRTKKPFKRVEELRWVRGIGHKTFAKLRPYLTVDGPTTAKSKIKLAKTSQ